jgi:hypothetical protein
MDEPDLTAELDAAEAIVMGDAAVVTEHAQLMSGGGYHVWNTEPYIEEIYPLADRIRAGQRFGGKVYRRRVIVVEDWTELAAGEGDTSGRITKRG